jgi:hypothetical protein
VPVSNCHKLYLLPPNQLEIPLFAFSAPCHIVSILSYTSDGLVQLSASLLDGRVDVLLRFLPVLLKLLVDLVRAITGLSREPVNLLASIGSIHLGVFAELGAFAGSIVLSGVLELGCVGWWRIWSAMA